MSDSSGDAMPRQPEYPTPADVLEVMEPCEPYAVGDIHRLFSDDVSRYTIDNRLKTLADEGKINRKEHFENRVTYWIDPEDDVED